MNINYIFHFKATFSVGYSIQTLCNGYTNLLKACIDVVYLVIQDIEIMENGKLFQIACCVSP